MDAQGILMLNSIREIFDIAKISFESMEFVAEKFVNEGSLIDAINIQKKCPAIAVYKFDFSTNPLGVYVGGHAMVASGVKPELIGASHYFIQCKNSYRNLNQGNFIMIFLSNSREIEEIETLGYSENIDLHKIKITL